MKKVFLLLLLILSFTIENYSQKEKQMKDIDFYGELGRGYALFNINNISTYVYSDGRMDIAIKGNAGFEYPKGSGKKAIYMSGFLWGGRVQGEIRVGGSTYRTGIVPGRILSNGIADDPFGEDVRIYRVRPDYKYCELLSELSDGEGTEFDIRQQYEKNWNEWPADWGAPYADVDGNGEYNPDVDIPGVPGADQTIWFVCNDFDPGQTDYLYNSLPMGFEVQVTIWGYKAGSAIENCAFRKYKLINKNKDKFDFTNMYVSIWADPDIGKASDDLIGCDTIINSGYAYNSVPYDSLYKNLPPPAAGFQLLHCPRKNNSAPHSTELGMTSFHPNTDMACGGWGEYYCLTLSYYSAMKGILWGTGESFEIPDELGGGYSKYIYSGNPGSYSGWLDTSPGDKRLMVNSGPFNLAYGDTQDVVFAVIAAGAEPGIDNLGAVSLLKNYAKQVQQFYDNNFVSAKVEIKPQASATGFDRKIILSWGSDVENVYQMEKKSIYDFSFQGYNVYQLPTDTSSINTGVKIATYDVIDETAIIIEDKLNRATGRVVPAVVQEGHNTGIERYIQIKKDYLKDEPLNNGTKYHYGVTAYYFNPKENTSPVTLETAPFVVSIFPQSQLPGQRIEYHHEDKISVTHLSGSGQADVDVMVIDPLQLTGHEYEITFHESAGQLTWNLEDLTLGETKLSNQTNITGTDEYYIVDGFRIIITQDTSDQLSSNDVFTFTTPAVTEDEELAKHDVEKINVFPNPYYGGHANELNQYHNYVMFNHLPKRAKFRIFNLAGHLVRTLEKDDDTQFYLWDLQNEHRLQAPSGLYIIYIEMPDLQKVKVLKLAIVQREVVPGNF